MKAVLQFRASERLRQRCAALSPTWLDIVVVDEADKAAFAREMRDAEVLLHVLEPVTADVIRQSPQLRLIQKIGVGVNTIDLDAARRANVQVANMPGTNSAAVAEMTLGLMFAAIRRIAPLDRATRSGLGWALPETYFDTAGEIAGSTVGLVGFGAVPQLLAPVLRALGARVIYANRSVRAESGAEHVPLDTLLALSDIVSLHVPLTPQTEKLIDAQALAKMKPGSVLINTARGGLLDENAMADALASGRLSAAGFDVLAVEPAGPDHPFFRFDNVVVTPHIGWLTPQTFERSMAIAIANCTRLRERGDLLHKVA